MRIWGCYQVNIMSTKLNILIISNVFVNAKVPLPIHETYDLKGSFVDRKTANASKAKVLKDSDLKYQFKVTDERRINLLQQLYVHLLVLSFREKKRKKNLRGILDQETGFQPIERT
jgi:hypothetical protein